MRQRLGGSSAGGVLTAGTAYPAALAEARRPCAEKVRHDCYARTNIELTVSRAAVHRPPLKLNIMHRQIGQNQVTVVESKRACRVD